MSKNTIKIAIGTYERVLLGVKGEVHLTPPESETTLDMVRLVPFFTTDDNTAYVSSLAASPSGRVLVSGSSDDLIRIYSMTNLKEVGSLGHHSGAVTDFAFNSNGSKLLSASEDGTIGVWRTSDWNSLGTLLPPMQKKEQVNGILSIALHLSGKVCLSCTKTGSIGVWDTVKGVLVSTSEPKGMKGRASGIRWILKDHSMYSVIAGDTVGLYATSDASGAVFQILNHSSKVLCISSISLGDSEYLCCGCADGSVYIWGMESDGQFYRLHTLDGANNRIKAIETISSTKGFLLASGTSSGSVLVWSFDSSSDAVYPVATYDCGMRITSLAIVSEVVKKQSSKRKKSMN